MTDRPRLIEAAFPLKQASIDSVHEKNVRHGHISTLHIWPARRPLAACRAALIATLLPDPGTPEERKKLVEKIGGTLVEGVKKKKMPNGRIEEIRTEETLGGVLHWGRESSPDMDWFRAKIREAYGGRAPKVLDPFAGGGAIPLEAMRLGCEVTAIDINPVAWFILKCTLEYPQKLAGQKRPLPDFILKDRHFMEEFFKAQGFKGAMLRSQLSKLGLDDTPSPLLTGMPIQGSTLEADLAWHVRAWGRWVLAQARPELARCYPTYAEFQPLATGETDFEPKHPQLVPINADGTLDLSLLNDEFSKEHLADAHNPRWVTKPTVAYLWARTVICKHCRAVVPLLKTCWLCKRDKKRIALTVTPNPDRTGVMFGVVRVPTVGTNAAQRREHDKRVGTGTMSRSGATCPCCGVIMTMEDVRVEGRAGGLGTAMTAVVVDGPNGKEYRLPVEEEIEAAGAAEECLEDVFSRIPFGVPRELITEDAKKNTWCVSYGVDQFHKLFTTRQLVALGSLVGHTRVAAHEMRSLGYESQWMTATVAYLALAIDRTVSFNSKNVRWKIDAEAVVDAFARYAIPVLWDFAEPNGIGDHAGAYALCLERICLALGTLLSAKPGLPPDVRFHSVLDLEPMGQVDLILTDPPYYDAIGYSVIMDFFIVWLRRALHGLTGEIDGVFRDPIGPKWNHSLDDGEIIDDSSRFDGDREKSKAVYEDGMFRAFQSCHSALRPDGRLVMVFAHKHPDAWETLVSANMRAGFVVDASWPIQTEMGNRTRAIGSAALSSSIWLVCKKRPETARPGWDNRVLDEMREKITTQLREFWDAGIRGPDFVWAATGPALEAYSKHPVVRKVSSPGELMTVGEFLGHVRRIVVDFVVGRVLSPEGEGDAAIGLDNLTAYYLLHRHDFGLAEAPIGGCILYAVSCGLSDRDLLDKFDLIAHTGGSSANADVDDNAESDEDDGEPGSSSAVKLKAWNQRKRKSLGLDDGSGRPIPLIDQIHRLMQLWQTGSVVDVNAYLDERGLRSNTLFPRVLQALVELATPGTDERPLLETIAKHVRELGQTQQFKLPVS